MPAEPKTPAGTPPQRSTRAPAEGADPRDPADFDHSEADGDAAPAERSPREPAEGRPDAGRA